MNTELEIAEARYEKARTMLNCTVFGASALLQMSEHRAFEALTSGAQFDIAEGLTDTLEEMKAATEEYIRLLKHNQGKKP